MKMKRINITISSCFLASAFFFTSCKSPSPSVLTEADKQYIRDATANVQDGWNRGQREPYVNRFSADAVFMAANMEAVVGKDAIRSFANSFPEIKIEYSIIEIMGSAEYAYVRGAYNITNPTDTLLDKGKYISIWKKFPEDKWLLTHDIFNSDLPVSVTKK
jgi:ketosteroid isomerase-like protein